MSPFFAQYMDPTSQGILAAGSAMLEASGPSLTPVNLGQVFARGAKAGLGAMQAGQDTLLRQQLIGAQMGHMQQQDALLRAQIAEAQRKTRLAEDQQAAIRRYVGTLTSRAAMAPATGALSQGAAEGDVGPTVTNAARMDAMSGPSNPGAHINPTDLLPFAALGANVDPFLKIREASLPKVQDGLVYDPASLRPGTFLPAQRDQRLGGSIRTLRRQPDGSETVVSNTPLSAAPASLPFWLRRDPVGNSTIDPVAFDAQRALARSGATRVDAGVRQETEFGKAVGKQFGESYADLMRADMNAPATIGKYQRLQSLLSQVSTGKFMGTASDLKAAAKSVGIDLTALGVADDVAPAQAARALSNQLALELRSPSGGAGMPGAMSDKDREFLVAMTPGLGNDPGSIGLMIEYRTRLAKREQEVARRARDYRKRTGRFDEGFFDGLAQWSERNPVFGDADRAAPQPAVPAPRRAGFRVVR